jgi:hypothetical protein
VFFRKRKKDGEDGLGLSAPVVSSGLTVTPSEPTVIPPAPTEATLIPAPPASEPPTPAPPGGIQSGGVQPGAFQPTALAPTQFPTTVPAMLGEILGGKGPIGEMIAQIKANPEAFRAQIMQRAQAAGISTYVMTPQGMTPSAGQHVDVIDELTKAAALHDKGALTDAEFEALKKKLLAE